MKAVLNKIGNAFKVIFKNVGSRVWFIVTCSVLVLAIIVNVLTSTRFFSAVCVVLGEPRMELLGENTSDFKTDGFNTKTETLANGNKVAKEVCEEGFTLLKNNVAGDGKPGLPLAEGSKISIFGKNSANVAIGGSGSGGSIGADAVSIFDSLTAAGFSYNQHLVDFYNDNRRSGAGRDANNSDLDSGADVQLKESFVGETPISSYSQAEWDSCNNYKDAALIVITRIGGEGADMPRTQTDHVMKLRQNEKELINKVKTMGFGRVVILLNTASALELKEVNDDEAIESILWIGYTGGNGMTALGEILKGKTSDGAQISPSGKTVDTYAANFMHSPTWYNFGAAYGNEYGTEGGRVGFIGKGAYFVDYEEDIYVGYRYYETRYAAYNGPITAIGESADLDTADRWYQSEVVYPFGYGLSYTKFKYELLNENEITKTLNKDTSVTFKIKVTNDGSYAGREVVQLYVNAPYNGNDNEVERSAKVLVGFAKTKLLVNNGDFDTVEITVDSPYAFASYNVNGLNGKGAYEVGIGNYNFILGTDAHSEFATVTSKVDETIIYDKDPVTGTTVENLFTGTANEGRFDSGKELQQKLSRKDWAGTWPQPRTNAQKFMKEEDVKYILDAPDDPNSPAYTGDMPATGEMHSISLSDMKYIDYDSDEIVTDKDTDNRTLIGKTHTEAWELFLDQLTVSEMEDLVNKGAFKTVAIGRLGVPQTIAADGPVGFVNFINAGAFENCTKYPCEVVLASTWNVDRLYDMGVALGNEALIGDEKNGNMPYTGWYAPGLNIHRTPFGGRNFEYYSEDPLLSGKMTASILKGLATKGVYADIKHFAVNEQETNRNGVLTWLTEQSMREVYLKGFEIAIKDAKAAGVKAMGVMSSFNRVGFRWTGGDYRLITTILRNEWGFEGLVICDFNTCGHMNPVDMFYSGNDINLEMAQEPGRLFHPDAKNASDVMVLRRASKNILFTISHSNAMRGDFRMHMPVWQIIMIVVDAVLAAGFIAWGVYAVMRAFKKENEVVAVKAADGLLSDDLTPDTSVEASGDDTTVDHVDSDDKHIE